METEPDVPVASSSTSHLLDAETLLSTPAHALSQATIGASLENIPTAQRLVTCTNLVLSGKFYDQNVLRLIVDVGLRAGSEEVELLEGDVRSRLEESHATKGDGWEGWSQDDVHAQLRAVLDSDEPRHVVARCLAVLQQARRRLDTFDTFHAPRTPPPEPIAGTPAKQAEEDIAAEDDDPWDDDPWAEGGDDEDDNDEIPPILDDPWAEDASEDEEPVPLPKADTATPDSAEPQNPPIDPSTFILQSVVFSALYFATSAHLTALRVVCQRHSSDIWPYRLAIVEAIPGWVSPADDDVLALLPSAGEDGEGRAWPKGKVVDTPCFLDLLVPHFGPASLGPAAAPALLPNRKDDTLSSDGISEWYTDRVFALDDLGLLDSQLTWVQHGAALGVGGLDAIGEDLSLLSRLIYDANLTPEQLGQWSLATWRTASEEEIVKAYLSNSTPDSVVDDIRRLVLPYLYVLESRAERAGNADPGLVQRMLHSAILELPLDLALPCFEASKATLRAPARLIKDDQTVARMALAILYGSDQRDAYKTMSAIFECLPVWDVSGGDPESDREATATTLESIADFVRPTVSSAGAHSAPELFIFFKPLPFSSLSRALDILDMQLMSGEVLSRWEVPVYLRTLLQSARNHDEQVTLAEKMVRRQATRNADERVWVALWEDMDRLQSGGDSLLRGAFGMLSKEELMRIFLGGVLSAGNFATAKKVIRRLEPEGHFTPESLEDVVLTTSKEFYMRAETGNIHTGDMKLAYECLSVPPETPAIHAERDFIQATSRLTTFRSLSNLTPAEIRHTTNKLDLIRRVLSTSDDAYRHTGIILELTDKLGYANDQAARAEVLAMLVDAAVAAEDWDLARDRVDEMVGMAQPDLGEGSGDDEAAHKLRAVVWRSCLALGRQAQYPDLGGRMALLAQAIALCPPDDVPVILPIWRKVEAEVAAHPEVLHMTRSTSSSGTPPSLNLPAGGEERVLGSRTAARAARLALDLGHGLRSFTGSPALGSARSPDLSRHDSRDSRDSRDGQGQGQGQGHGHGGALAARRDSSSARRDAAALFDDGDEESVRAVGRRALVRGVGWLLGAEEGEM